jgi:hypothetical protein
MENGKRYFRVMKGYKASYNQWCLGMHYEVGKTYEMKEKPVLCSHGFHFCEYAHNVFAHYPYWKEFVLFEINALGNISSDGVKSCTNKIEIVRIIPKEEYKNIFDLNLLTFDEHDNIIRCDYGFGMEYHYDHLGNVIEQRTAF